MIWSIVWSTKARRQLNKIDGKIADRIVYKINDIKEEPYLTLNKLTGSKFFRLRVGDYRVIIDLQENKLVIFVVKVKHRKKIYKN